MKLKLDENLPSELVALLGDLGHDAHTVEQEGLIGEPDSVIRAAAAREERLLITQDVEFADKRAWSTDPGSGVVLVRVRNDTRSRLLAAVARAFATEPVTEWQGRLVVVSETKVRVIPV